MRQLKNAVMGFKRRSGNRCARRQHDSEKEVRSLFTRETLGAQVRSNIDLTAMLAAARSRAER